MGRFDGAVSGIRSLLNSAPAPRVTAEIDPDVVRYLERLRADEVSRLPTDMHGRPHIGGEVEGWPRGTDAFANPRTLDTLDVPPVRPNDLSLDSPLFRDMYRADQAFDNIRRGRTPNLRNSGGDLARIAGQNIREADDAARAARAADAKRDAAYMTGGALGLAALGTGVSQMSTPGTAPKADEEPAVVSGGEADLAEEARPAPKVEAVEEPVDYSLQAREMINKLNAMRRAAGGEVPEAPAMQKEIERLLALGNQTRRATAVAAPGDDASRLYQQAQMLIDQVNQMYRQGASQGSPEVQRIMQQVRQLQAQGDAIRNRRAG